MRFKQTLLISLVITSLLFAINIDIANAQISSLWKVISGALHPVISTWELGSNTTRIAKGWFTDLDVSGAFTLGGTVGAGGIDLNGNSLILDVDGNTSITADTDDQIDFEVSGADQIVLIDGALYPTTDSDVDLGTSAPLYWANAYIDKIYLNSTAAIDGTTAAGLLNITGNIGIRSNAELRFYDNGNYVGFEAPALSADQIWVLPTADGNANEVLSTDGAGTLSWAAAGGAPTLTSITPKPNGVFRYVTQQNVSTTTTAHFGAFFLPGNITVNKLSIEVQSYTSDGTVDIGIYSEDGQTKHIDITTATITGTGVVSTAVSSVELTAGIYYVVVVPNGGTRSIYSWDDIGAYNLLDIASEPVMVGTKTVTAGTLPTTFDPVNDITGRYQDGIIIRLDN